MEDNKQITFRRIRGRLVPIRIKNKEDAKRRNFGIGASIVGLAISGAATKLSYKAAEKSQKLSSRSHKLAIKAKWATKRTVLFGSNEIDLFKYSRRQKTASKLMAGSIKLGRRAKILRKAVPHIKNIGIWTGASILGSGLARVFEEREEGDMKGTLKELGFTAASAAALYGSGDKAVRVKVGRALAKIISKGRIK